MDPFASVIVLPQPWIIVVKVLLMLATVAMVWAYILTARKGK